MAKKKCQRQKQENQGRCQCHCLTKIDPYQHFRANTRDMAAALIKVMIICGIPEHKARTSKKILVNTFKHYDEIRYRIDELPTKILRKEHLIYDLGCKCAMTRMEAQLTFSIVKRAFKAFYYGTDEFSIKDPRLQAQMVHSQECLWVHAARRTAQIYGEYEGMFFPVQKKIEEQIKCVYKALYDRMLKRANPLVLQSCCCQNCVDKVESQGEVKEVVDMSLSFNDETSINLPDTKKRKRTRKKLETSKTIETNENIKSLPHCEKCKCPKLTCDCRFTKDLGILSHDCSQGPFKVRWIRIDDEYEADPFETELQKPETPIVCDDLSEMELESDAFSIDAYECEAEICEEELQTETSTEISTLPTVYSCHMPEVDYTPIMLDCKHICDCGDPTAIPEELPCKSRSNKSKSTTSSRLISGESGLTGKSTDKTSDYEYESSGDDLPGDGLLRKIEPITEKGIDDGEPPALYTEPPKSEKPFKGDMGLKEPPKVRKLLKDDRLKKEPPKTVEEPPKAVEEVPRKPTKPAKGNLRKKETPKRRSTQPNLDGDIDKLEPPEEPLKPERIGRRDSPKLPKIKKPDKDDKDLVPVKPELSKEIIPKKEPKIESDTEKGNISQPGSATDLRKIRRISDKPRKSSDTKKRQTSTSDDGKRRRFKGDKPKTYRKKKVSFSEKTFVKCPPCKICTSRPKKRVSKVCIETNEMGRVSFISSGSCAFC